jgi:uncharacterized protein YcgI (DUF1989 family)
MSRELLYETVIQPGTGKALEVLRGQVLRIEQVEDGGQCADFNCFNLHDYKEHFHTARTRHVHGLMPSTGAFLWSASPRDRPMGVIVSDTVGSNDILYGRCSAWIYDYQYGLPVHANCHDMQAEAQREYGLTPDDVHDSFNFFMNTGIDQNGHPYIGPNLARKGDYVEILALIDTLMVPNVCGADVMATNNFQYKPLRLAVFAGTPEDLAKQESRAEMRGLTTQRTVDQFTLKEIRATRELTRDTSFQPQFINVRITLSEVPVSVSDSDAELLDSLVATGAFGSDRAQALRWAFHLWWIERYMQGPKHLSKSAS